MPRSTPTRTISIASRTTASSTAIARVDHSPSPGLSGKAVFRGSDDADPGTGLGGGWRLSPVELWLPELSRCSRGHDPRHAADPGERGRQRERRGLHPAERLAGDPPADRRLRRTPSARPPSLTVTAILRRNGDLDHCLGLLSLPNRTARGLRPTAFAWIHGRQRAVPDARSLSRSGHLALAPARQEEELGDLDGGASGLQSRPGSAGQAPIHLEAGPPGRTASGPHREASSGRISPISGTAG
jgi:hypothetical protein